MRDNYATKIDTRIVRNPYADTIYYIYYKSNCETIDSFVDLLNLEYPKNPDREWWKPYIKSIEKLNDIFTIEEIIPYND